MSGEMEYGVTAMLDDDGRVVADVHCTACRYNLRGLDAKAKCPECGSGVTDTLAFLATCPIEWVRSAARSAAVLGVCVLVGAPLSHLLLTCPQALAGRGLLSPLLAALLAAGLIVTGALSGLSARDPRRAAEPEGLTARRVASAGRLFLPALAVAISCGDVPMLPGPGRLNAGVALHFAALLVILILGPAVLRTLAAHLASLRATGLARRLRVLSWVVVGVQVVGVVVLVFAVVPWRVAGALFVTSGLIVGGGVLGASRALRRLCAGV